MVSSYGSFHFSQCGGKLGQVRLPVWEHTGEVRVASREGQGCWGLITQMYKGHQQLPQ